MYGIGIVSNNVYTFCFNEPQTLIHLFCDGKTVDTLWNDVFNWILAAFRINIALNSFHKLFEFHAEYINY